MSRFISRISFRIEINSWISCWDMPGSGDPVEGWGLYEHGALGRHDPSGFKDWLTVAP